MTRRQDDKGYQMLPKISKKAKKSCQRLTNIAKLCQMLPNDANRYLKWSTTKTKILQLVVKKMPIVSNLWQTLEQIYKKKLTNIAESWQKVASSAKSSQKLPKVFNCWQKLSEADTMTQ